jgi:hypothetical protein
MDMASVKTHGAESIVRLDTETIINPRQLFDHRPYSRAEQ